MFTNSGDPHAHLREPSNALLLRELRARLERLVLDCHDLNGRPARRDSAHLGPMIDLARALEGQMLRALGTKGRSRRWRLRLLKR